MFCEKHNNKLWYLALRSFLKFFLHFILVCGILVGGAFVFVKLEEDKVNITNKREPNITKFWEKLSNLYNITASNKDKQNILLHFQDFIEQEQLWKIEYEASVDSENYYGLFRKWFYFTTIAATTIGYGDVAPTTQEGRVFFIAFAIISVPAMITLLARCGAILTSINVHFFDFIYKLCCKKKELISAGMLSALTFFMFFLAYMQIGPILTSIEVLNWTYIDSIYYWFVTFTTIGFGDINYEINDTQYFLLLYRIFGLALVAGIVDSLVTWIKRRRKNLKKLDKEKLFKAAYKMQKISTKFTDSALKGIDNLQPISAFLENKLASIKTGTPQSPETPVVDACNVMNRDQLVNFPTIEEDAENAHNGDDEDDENDITCRDENNDVTYIHLDRVPVMSLTTQKTHPTEPDQVEPERVDGPTSPRKTNDHQVPLHQSDKTFLHLKQPLNVSPSSHVHLKPKPTKSPNQEFDVSKNDLKNNAGDLKPTDDIEEPKKTTDIFITVSGNLAHLTNNAKTTL